MGFLTPLLWETQPALNLRIGTSPSGEGEGGWVKTSPTHQNTDPRAEGKTGGFVSYPGFPKALHTTRQPSARWGEQQSPRRGAEVPEPIAHGILPTQGSQLRAGSSTHGLCTTVLPYSSAP